MKPRKIAAMYEFYDISGEGKCKDCCNFITGQYRGRTYGKCLAYGATHCEATDWNGRHTACGLFGKEFKTLGRRPLLEVLKAGKRTVDAEPLEGQISLFGS